MIDVVILSYLDSTVIGHAVAFLPAEFRGKELNIDLVLRHLHQMSPDIVSGAFHRPCETRRRFVLPRQYDLDWLFPRWRRIEALDTDRKKVCRHLPKRTCRECAELAAPSVEPEVAAPPDELREGLTEDNKTEYDEVRRCWAMSRERARKARTDSNRAKHLGMASKQMAKLKALTANIMDTGSKSSYSKRQKIANSEEISDDTLRSELAPKALPASSSSDSSGLHKLRRLRHGLEQK